MKWIDRVTNEEVLRKTGTDRAQSWVREVGYLSEGTWEEKTRQT